MVLAGAGHDRTASTFAGSVPTPSWLTMWPRNPTLLLPNWHLDGFTFSPAVRRRCRTSSSLSRCSSKLAEKTTMSSK